MGSVNTVRDAGKGTNSDTDEDGGPADGKPVIGRCFDCHRNSDAARSCTTTTITFPDGIVREAIRYGTTWEQTPTDRCRGCGVSAGGYHHPFCPVEACPRCGGRLATCSCLDADKTR